LNIYGKPNNISSTASEFVHLSLEEPTSNNSSLSPPVKTSRLSKQHKKSFSSSMMEADNEKLSIDNNLP